MSVARTRNGIDREAGQLAVPLSRMLREIREQPGAVRRALAVNERRVEHIAAEFRRHDAQVIVLAGRGTSDHAALYAQYLLQQVTGIPAALATPSLATLYGTTLRLRHAVVIGISQSGESPDIVEVLRRAREDGALTVAVTNQPDSPLATAASETLYCAAGPERSVAATKTYTTTCAVLALLASALPGGEALRPCIARVPDLITAALATEAQIDRAVTRYVHARDCVVLGRSFQYSTARETALKLEETCYVVATPFSSADFRHGPAALVERGLPVIMFAPPGKTAEESRELLDWLRASGADCVVVAQDADLLERGTTPVALHLPRMEEHSGNATTPASTNAGAADIRASRVGGDVDELLAPLAYVVPGQLFAHALARQKGLDPDHPRSLSKVTRTR